MKRRIVTKLRIDELSSVDRPAQPGALVRIMKRYDDGSAADRFEAKVQEIQKREGCSGTAAMSRARIENADLFAAMQEAPVCVPVEKRVPCAADAAAAAAVAKARGQFMDRAREIAKRDRVPLHTGMSRARVEAPELFAAWG